MWEIARNYVSACSNSVQLVPLHPIIMSILFHHYKELKECISEVEQIESKVNSSTKRIGLTEREEKQEEEVPATLDSFLSSESAAAMERCTT
jgi:t-SNARE complex subunit (syntaxin)